MTTPEEGFATVSTDTTLNEKLRGIPENPERYIMICMPMRSSEIEWTTFVSYQNAVCAFEKRGWKTILNVYGGSVPVHIARNILVCTFLRMPECTDLFFVDSDIAAPPDVWTRFIDYPVDIVVGLYKKRDANNPNLYPINSFFDDGTYERDPATGLIKIFSFGMGFTRIRRHVIEALVKKMEDKYPDNWFWPADEFPNEKVKCWRLFDFKIASERMWSEDIYFYGLCHDNGYEVWGDPTAQLVHVGKFNYTGVFAESPQYKVRLLKS